MMPANGYAEELGDQLRNVRQQQGLSLSDVEARSDGQLKASVVGAYERGERAVSVARLRDLAEFYRVPIAQLLPRNATEQPRGEAPQRLRLDLVRLGAELDGELGLVQRYLATIQARRRDYNGRVLTLRRSDIDALSAVLDVAPDQVRDRLASEGVLLD